MAAFGAVLFLSLLKIIFGDNTDILIPTKKCVATGTQLGACHVCVCKTDGVFHCLRIKCNIYSNVIDSHLPECAADHTYRMDTILCTCDSTGHWRSERCRGRLFQMKPRTSPYVAKIATNIKCKKGYFYISECNICACSDSGLINFESCTNRRCTETSKLGTCNPGDFIRTTTEFCGCSDINYFIDRLCLKIDDVPIQEVDIIDLDGIIDIGHFWNDFRINCKPFYTYQVDCSKCYCNAHGRIFSCEYKECGKRYDKELESLRVRKQFRLKDLPELNSLNEICKSGNKYRYKCNTCYCTNASRPICTSMICLDQLKFSLNDLSIRQRKRTFV